MTCGIWKRSLLPSGFISLFQPLCLQHGSQLPVPCSGASWTGGAHRDPPWRAEGLSRALARNPCFGQALFHTCLRSREGWYAEKMKPLARQPGLLEHLVRERQNRSLSVFLRVSYWGRGKQIQEALEREQNEFYEEVKDVGKERGLRGHSGQDPGPSFRGPGETLGYPCTTFYSFLFGKAGAQVWSPYVTLVFSMFLDFILGLKQLCLLLARSMGTGSICQHWCWWGPGTSQPAPASVPSAVPVCEQCWICVKHPALTSQLGDA